MGIGGPPGRDKPSGRAEPPGAHPVGLCLPRASSGLLPKLPDLLLVQKNHKKNLGQLDFVWYLKPKKRKTRRKQQLALGTGSVG